MNDLLALLQALSRFLPFFASWLKTQHNVSFLALTMAPDVSRNVRPSIFNCILAVLFVVKLLTNSQLYHLPKAKFILKLSAYILAWYGHNLHRQENMGNFVVEEQYERGFESLPIGIVEEPNKFNFFFSQNIRNLICSNATSGHFFFELKFT